MCYITFFCDTAMLLNIHEVSKCETNFLSLFCELPSGNNIKAWVMFDLGCTCALTFESY